MPLPPHRSPAEATSAAPGSAPGPDLAIVLSGGGARAAYQVGLLRGIGRHLPELRFPIVTGVSAGAINASFLASHPGGLAEAAGQLGEIWAGLTVQDIFRADLPSFSRILGRWGAHMVGGGSPRAPEVRGLVDTRPLRATIRRAAATVDDEIIGVERNLERGLLRALALTTLNYTTGETVTWVQGRDVVHWQRGMLRSQAARMTVDHVMASAALPLFFPAVRLGDSWYGDGGVRLASPLSPALRLGACRILAVSPSSEEAAQATEWSAALRYPPPAQILSHLLDAVFLDVLDQDVDRLQQTNQLLVKLPPEERNGLRPVDLLVLRPSEDLGELATALEPQLPAAFRYLTRSLGTRETTNPAFLSYLMFQPDYLNRLMEIGEKDAEAHIPAVRRLVGA